ncbi:MAG: type II toxin-antitoxin system VapC family toxin [Gammaproteobacteria bacterium]
MLVLDASVIAKWLLNDPRREAASHQAAVIMRAITAGELTAVQPAHWLAEVAAVLARLTPRTVQDDVAMLQALELPIVGDAQIMRRACRLAIELNQHVSDTLYHAVALEIPGARLVTADERYVRKARHLGRLVRLEEWVASP